MTITELQKKYKLSKNDFWELKRGGNSVWIITHDACEKIAHKEKITLDKIEVLSSEWYFCRLLVTMSKKEVKEISIGEALLNTDEVVKKGKYGPVKRGNCESQYIGAMAEKRGKDRCILKLINAYEYGIYSDSESDDFKRISKPVKGISKPASTGFKCDHCQAEAIMMTTKTGAKFVNCPNFAQHKAEGLTKKLSPIATDEFIKKNNNFIK